MSQARKLKSKAKKRRLAEIYEQWKAGNMVRAYKMKAFVTLYDGTAIVGQEYAHFEKIEMPGERLLIRLEGIPAKVKVTSVVLEVRDFDESLLHHHRIEIPPEFAPGCDAIKLTAHIGLEI